jgi:hypothetical protein
LATTLTKLQNYEMEKRTFVSLNKKSRIDVTCENDLANFEIIEVCFENLLPFMQILLECCLFMKEKNTKYVVQTIKREEFGMFKHSEKIHDDGKLSVIIIKTPIDKFLDELTDVLGIDAIKV